jgi:hypothetical protein
MSEVNEDALEQADDLGVGPEDALAPDEDAPFGYTIDRKTGERRPKKVGGRPKAAPPVVFESGTTPGVEALKSQKREQTEDRAPGKASKNRTPKFARKPKETVDAPPFRAGPIASGMNKLYLRAGKIVRIWDEAIGQAIIETTRKEAPDDVTVGEAWEELARTNPRIRIFLLRLISGGVYTQLIMAHMPILLALLMKDAIRDRLPFGKVMEAFIPEDGDVSRETANGTQANSLSDLLAGMTPEDMQMAAGFAQNMMRDIGGTGRTPETQ